MQCHTEYIHAAAAYLDNFRSQKNRISWAQIRALMPERGTAASENTKIFWQVSILVAKANYIFCTTKDSRAPKEDKKRFQWKNLFLNSVNLCPNKRELHIVGQEKPALKNNCTFPWAQTQKWEAELSILLEYEYLRFPDLPDARTGFFNIKVKQWKVQWRGSITAKIQLFFIWFLPSIEN